MSLRVSLVVPVRDEAAALPHLIESIKAQTLPPAEIIIVDGGSTDNTIEIARSLTATDRRCRIIEAGPATPGRGRNIGFRAATSEWIAFVDSGIVLESKWLEELVAVAQAKPVDVVFGNYEPQENSFFERCSALAFVEPKRMRDGIAMRGPSITSSLMRKSVLEKLGGFPDLRNGEDLILISQLISSEAVGWAPKATAWWALQPSVGKTFQRFRLYSRNSVYAKMERQWHFGVLRIYLLLFPPTAAALITGKMLLLAIPCALHALRTAKSIWTRGDRRRWASLLNPLVFLSVATILLVLDTALFTGWIEGLLGVKRPSHSTEVSQRAAGASQ